MVSKAITKSFVVFLLFVCHARSLNDFNVAVVFNSMKLAGSWNETWLNDSFKRIPLLLNLSTPVRFMYIDLNSSFCELGKFLSILPRGIKLVALLEDCSCKKKLLLFLRLLNIRLISQCDEMVMTVKGASAVVQHTRRDRRCFLAVPRNAHGIEFYERLSCLLKLKNIFIHSTLWVSKDEDISRNEMQLIFQKLNQDLNKNEMTSATFIVALTNLNGIVLKNLLDVARLILKKNFNKVVWIFPHINIYSKLRELPSFGDNARVFSFRDSFSSDICTGQECSRQTFYSLLEKTYHVIKSIWTNDQIQTSKEGHVSTRTQQKEHCSTLNDQAEGQRHSQEVIEMGTNEIFQEVNWQPVGIWNGETIQLLSNKDKSDKILLPPETIFRVPVVEYFPFIIKHKFLDHYPSCPSSTVICYGVKKERDNDTPINYSDRYCCSGLTIDVLIYLLSDLSYQFELYFQEDKVYGVYNKTTGSWNGIFGDVLSGKADLGLDLGLAPDRCSVLDCSLGYLFMGFNTVTRLSDQTMQTKDLDSFSSLVGNFQVFLNPYQPRLLLTVLMVFNIFVILIWGSDKICLYYRNKRTGKRDKFIMLESTSYVWATAFGRDVGDSKKPLTFSARYISSWLAFLSLIFVNVYMARLMAELVKERSSLAFVSLRDPKILNKEVDIGVVSGSTMEAYFHNTRDTILKKSFENIKRNLIPELNVGVDAVRKGDLDGFIADSISLQTLIQRDASCSLSLIGKDFHTVPLGFVFRKNWPWSEEFKLFELSMNERNTSSGFWKKHFPHSCARSVTHPQLSIADVSGVFMILLFGIAYCIFSLLVENSLSWLFYRYQRTFAKWSVPKAGD